MQQAHWELSKAHAQTSPLRYDWQNFAYTDGSVLSQPEDNAPGIGSGVYMPPKGPATYSDNDQGTSVAIDPRDATSREDTINRAELVAIHKAVEQGATHIATDSLGSIFQSKKMLMRPQDMHEHRHAHLLRTIVDKIAAGQNIVHIYKVKSHIGIVGNERADEIATGVAHGRLAPDEWDTTPSNDRGHMHWPHIQQTREVQGQTQTQYIPLANMAEQLKEKAHQTHRLGRANTTGIYYSKWKEAHARMDGQTSNAFMKSKETTYTERKNAIKYRYGGLYTAKLAHRYGHTKSDKCPLCGQPDGGHHAASACPALSLPVTARHHKAGRIIMRAIQTGRQGAPW
jgi:ribonuclease HI